MKLLTTCILLATTTAYAAPKTKPPVLFAKFFVDGATWKFKTVHEKDELTEHGPRKNTTKGTLECAVSDVSEIRGGWRATLECSGGDVGVTANGTYVATPAGLWRPDDTWDGETKSLDKKYMLIGAVPKAGDRHYKTEGDGDDAYRITKFSSGWCFGVHSALGDETGWMLCISQRKGIIGGNNYFAGAETDDFYYGESPHY